MCLVERILCSSKGNQMNSQPEMCVTMDERNTTTNESRPCEIHSDYCRYEKVHRVNTSSSNRHYARHRSNPRNQWNWSDRQEHLQSKFRTFLSSFHQPLSSNLGGSGQVEERRWATLTRQSLTLCSLSHYLPWHLEVLQTGSGIDLDMWRSRLG